ncbi:MAG: (d)CMP kinase [Bacteroidales bacterium]|nr:(d)CMP kinase [Bacteroidales bacterium]
MAEKKSYTIAIDGYSSCGKSTFAKEIARELNLLYIDSGAMYRAVALYSLENRIYENGKTDLERLKKALPSLTIEFRKNETNGDQDTYLNNRNVEKEIRNVEVSEAASTLSKIREVREHLVKLQRSMSHQTVRSEMVNGVVMDGRDIGTVVFPQADMKIFMTADPDIRAKRRYDELMAKGVAVSYEEIRNNVMMRDHQDETRKESPLRKADDALVLDNSNMTVSEQMEWFKIKWENIKQHHEGGN